MIVCSCNVITRRDVESVIEEILAADPYAVLTPNLLYHRLGRRGKCCGCFPHVTRILVERIEELNQRGVTFVIIEHDMDFVMRHCDPVIALAEGRVVFQGTVAEAQADPLLLEAYLGTAA